MSKFAVFLPILFLAACGGSKPPADSPKAEDGSAEQPPKEKPADDAKADGSDTNKPAAKSDGDDKKKSDAKADEGGPKPTRSAQDILTAPDTTFEVSFNDSDVKEAAESKCTASSGNDPKKMSQCMSKARKALDVDAYRFKQKDNQWWMLTLRTKGKTIVTLHKFEVDLEEKDRTVIVKPKGKDFGAAPGRTPGSITIQVPNDYQIVITDPKFGKLVYNAKIGVASDDSTK